MSETPSCEHQWVFIESHYKSESGSYQIFWKRLDRFYCSKCLEEREVRKQECNRDTPDWWKSK